MSEYRIEEREGGFEPQILCNTGLSGEMVWFPLMANGYWSDPDAYSTGKITKRSVLTTRDEAERAVLRAKAINTEHIRALPQHGWQESKE